MTHVSKHYELQWKSEFSALSEIQLGRPRRANLQARSAPWQRVVGRRRGTDAGTCTTGTNRLDDVGQIRRTRPVENWVHKARPTPATMSKQHCRMLQCRMLLRHCCRFGNNVEATFDFVAKNGTNVERVLRWNFVLSTKSNVASTTLLRHCC